jgi:hypothetical protein
LAGEAMKRRTMLLVVIPYSLAALLASHIGFYSQLLSADALAATITYILTRSLLYPLIAALYPLAELTVDKEHILLAAPLVLAPLIAYDTLRGRTTLLPGNATLGASCKTLSLAPLALALTALLESLHPSQLSRLPAHLSLLHLAATTAAPLLIQGHDPATTATALAASPYSLVPIMVTMLSQTASPANENKMSMTRKQCIELGSVEAVLAHQPPPALRYSPRWLPLARHVTEWGWRREHRRLGLCFDVTSTPHALVTGTTGAGKTTTTASIVSACLTTCDNTRIVIIDPHGEYGSLLGPGNDETLVLSAGKVFLNPLSAYHGADPRQASAEFTRLLAALYSLGPLQQNLLYNAVLAAYAGKGPSETPSLADVVRELRETAKEDPRALRVLAYIHSLTAFFGENTLNIEDIIKRYRLIIFDLSAIGSTEARIVYAEALARLLYIYSKGLGITQQLRLLLVIDEAQSLAPHTAKGATIARMAAELRKFGVAIIFSTQQASMLPSSIPANIGTLIALRQNEPKENHYTALLLSGVRDEQRTRLITYTLANLPKGYAVVRVPGEPEPLLVSLKAPMRPHSGQGSRNR